MEMLSSIILILLIFITICTIYLFLLALIGIVGKKRLLQSQKNYRFLILVPAHNEEKNISTTIESLLLADNIGYSKIVIIADNCTDTTAEIARSFSEENVDVIERSDPVNIGKGFALEWAIDKYDLIEFNAVSVIDADTQVQPNFLQVMTNSFEQGYGAIQLNYRFINTENTYLSQLQLIANTVENILFYNARAILKLPVLLRGTGMAIKADILKKHPWDSHSVTEDVDFSITLLKNNILIDYSIESEIFSPVTSTYQQSYTQKLRWAAGTFILIKNQTFPLIIQGIKKGKLKFVELAFSLLLLSRPLLINITIIAALLSLFLNPIQKSFYLTWALILVSSLVVYIMLGIFFVENKIKSIKSIILMPVYAIWMIKVQIQALFKSKNMTWERTDRS